MARHALPGHFVFRMNVEEAMTFRLFAVTTAALANVRRELFALRDQWRALVPKGALELTYP